MNLSEAYAKIIPHWHKGSISIEMNSWLRQRGVNGDGYRFEVNFSAFIFDKDDLVHTLRAKTLDALVTMVLDVIAPPIADLSSADQALAQLSIYEED